MIDEGSDALLARAAGGDVAAWGHLLTSHEPRLQRLVGFRMDSRLRGRLEAADIVQDAFVEASEHREHYFRAPEVPLFLWLRRVTINKLIETQRRHVGTRKRDAAREKSLDPVRAPDDTSAAIGEQLAATITGPRTAAARRESRLRLASALESMDERDREVLALRHFEQLTSGEAAQVLGIEERAAAKRYLRALKRLREILSAMPGGLTELRP